MRSIGYKANSQSAERQEIVEQLHSELDFEIAAEALVASADVLDAAICLLAGKDFLLGKAFPPVDASLAVKEGWIWAAQPASTIRS
jgi:hypothetical protein